MKCLRLHVPLGIASDVWLTLQNEKSLPIFELRPPDNFLSLIGRHATTALLRKLAAET